MRLVRELKFTSLQIWVSVTVLLLMYLFAKDFTIVTAELGTTITDGVNLWDCRI